MSQKQLFAGTGMYNLIKAANPKLKKSVNVQFLHTPYQWQKLVKLL